MPSWWQTFAEPLRGLSLRQLQFLSCELDLARCGKDRAGLACGHGATVVRWVKSTGIWLSEPRIVEGTEFVNFPPYFESVLDTSVCSGWERYGFLPFPIQISWKRSV